jgi:hypothetical protein
MAGIVIEVNQNSMPGSAAARLVIVGAGGDDDPPVCGDAYA